MTMTYQAPVGDIAFTLKHAAGLKRALDEGLYGDLTEDLVDAVLEEAGKFATDVIAPLNRVGDAHGTPLEDGRVKMPPGWKDAYTAWAAAGWNGLAASADWGGQGLPHALNAACIEMWHSASMAFGLGPLLTMGAAEALAAHGSDALKQTYLPKLISGEWMGTMQLTEPQAGSDLSQLRTKAERHGDGTYRITGQKIFITYGEHDLTDNIVHFVLARLPDAPPGTRGISLFLVPKYLVNPDATLGVGLEGVAVAERATQQALAYARERRQGRAPDAADPGMSPILAHPDVQRMLLLMRASTRAARAICYMTAAAIDRSHRERDEAARERAQERASLLTPVAKAFSTDIGIEVASLGVQVHGGMGFIEETGAAQHYRDARIAAIYEGTNGIQAIDLVTRKLPLSGGAAARAFLQELRGTVAGVRAVNDPALGATAERLGEAIDSLDRATDWLLAELAGRPEAALAGATPYLRLFAVAAGGCALAEEA